MLLSRWKLPKRLPKCCEDSHRSTKSSLWPGPRKTNRPKSCYKEPVRFTRTESQNDERFVALLRVDVDWGGTGIWEIPTIDHPHAGMNRSYESLGLPQWMIGRFEYWTSWHDSHEPWKTTPGYDSQLYFAYAMSLAIDSKRFLGDSFYVECNGREVHDDRAYLGAFFGRDQPSEPEAHDNPHEAGS